MIGHGNGVTKTNAPNMLQISKRPAKFFHVQSVITHPPVLHMLDAALSYEIRAMGDRVAVIYDTPGAAYIHELKLDQAGVMLAQLVQAIREARAVEMAG